MANNKITLKLDGTVPLNLYNRAVGHFTLLVSHLTEEIVGRDGVQWTVTELHSGSAFIEVTGVAAPEAERVTAGYVVVAKALQSGDVIPYSQLVTEEAIGITNLLNGKITGAQFGDATDVKSIVNKPVVYNLDQESRVTRDFGVIEGLVRSVTDTKSLSE